MEIQEKVKKDEDRKRKMNDELETLKKNLNRENMDKERIEKEIKDIQDVIEDYRKQTTNKDRNISETNNDIK